MNRNSFLDIMESPGAIDSRLTGELNELVTVFPYFQSAHILLLRGLKDNSDVRFGVQLGNSSIHVADREILYRFLLDPPACVSEEHSGVDVSHPPREIIIEEQKETETSAGLQESNMEEQEIESSAGLRETITGVEAPSEEIMIEEPTGINISAPENCERMVVQPEEELLELETGETDTPGNDTRKIQAELIDRFIIANPRIEPDRERKDVPSEDRSIPIYNEGVFVTETLARIYISQGYYSKAIDIFEKLSLKFPEKSSYFATQIEKVKEFLKK